MKIWPESWNPTKKKKMPIMEMRIRVVEGRVGLKIDCTQGRGEVGKVKNSVLPWKVPPGRVKS